MIEVAGMTAAMVGSVLVFAGRAYSQVRAMPLVPLGWTLTGEVALAMLPLAMTLMDGWPLQVSRAAWLVAAVGACVMGVRVGHAAGRAVKRAREYDELTFAALHHGTSIETMLIDMRRQARKLVASDPVFAEVWRQSGLEDRPTPAPGIEGRK